MTSSSYLPQVRRQYEQYPYPERRPEDEKKRLSVTAFDGLGKINHYCYRGRRDFRKGFRVLIAGGGTGDALIYLAEQLRETDARLVYLDISEASMTIAKKRAEIRKLDRIEWVSGSILDLPRLDLGPFDYINCTGVLHHLADPPAGLACLRDVLADEGAMGIMVYGQYGRTGIYQVQALMRLIDQGEKDPQVCVENAKAAVKCLPATNWFKKVESQFPNWNENDIEVYDLFLHSQDRAYTVPQLYEWVEGCGLRLVDFCDQKLMYRPEYALQNPTLQQKIASLPLRDRQAIAELAFGALSKHSFFVSKEEETMARPDDFETIPFLSDDIPHSQLMAAVQNQPLGKPITLNVRGTQFGLQNTPLTLAFFQALDGNTPVGTMIQSIEADPKFAGKPPARDLILKEFNRFFNTLHLLDCLFLRHQSIPPYPRFQELQDRVTRMYM